MAKQSLEVLKERFEDGQRPTGEHFSDVFDSFLHLAAEYDLQTPEHSGTIATEGWVNEDRVYTSKTSLSSAQILNLASSPQTLIMCSRFGKSNTGIRNICQN